jgi:uncharacterized protein (DUF1697 family)
MEAVVALLRAVNVGGRQVQMTALRSRLSEVGCTNVRTYIQSGNIVLSPPETHQQDLAMWLEDTISAFAAFRVPVIVRATSEINRTVADNPYPHAEHNQLHVLFFADPLPADLLAGIDPAATGDETWKVAGPDLYMHLPHGMGRAVLPGLVERECRKANLHGTARNWNTVTTLARMAREPVDVKKR